VAVTGICGSDLHTYLDARIGDTSVESPLTLGHEFGGLVESVGSDALDGFGQPLRPGTRVAVDPARPCGRCEWCEKGLPNVCRRLHFCGNYPDGGSLCQWIRMPARCCFPVPPEIDDESVALLEPFGVALHAADLARIPIGGTVAIVGAGFVGLCLLQLALLAGAGVVFINDPLPWRAEVARQLGGRVLAGDHAAAVANLFAETGGRGVDVAFEAAWADHSVETAVELTVPGGRVVLVGIPSSDRLEMKHSAARRKGLELVFCRRMRHAYPRAIGLAAAGRVQLGSLVSHRFDLVQAPEAFSMNAAYQDRVIKAVIRC